MRDTKFLVSLFKIEDKMKLAKFLDKYDTVIFDMDGVITSEQNYWNCAALTVWEWLSGDGVGIDAKECMGKIPEIRARVFCGDKLISILKGKGVNSNWDLGYVVVLMSWICGGRGSKDKFSDVLDMARSLSDNIIEEYDNLARLCAEKTGLEYEYLKRNAKMWIEMRDIFQTWFLGDELFLQRFGYIPENSGKTGLIYKEEPIINKQRLIDVLRLLSADKRVCTGTGRPYVEMIEPITSWGIKKYFAPDGLVNYDYVVAAEKALDNNALTKPHPYMFLKALYGAEYDDKKIVCGDYDSSKIKTTLIVGDAGADILAAKAMGADFCAVLTGIQGEGARSYFENVGAEYIVPSVENFAEEE